MLERPGIEDIGIVIIDTCDMPLGQFRDAYPLAMTMESLGDRIASAKTSVYSAEQSRLSEL